MTPRCSFSPTFHEKIGLSLGQFHLTLSVASAPLSAHLSDISLKNSPLCARILTNSVKSPMSTLFLSSSIISRRMSPSGNSWIMGLQPSPIHGWIESRRHLESVSMTMSFFRSAAAANEFSRASAAAACSDLLEEPPSSLFPTLQQPPVPVSCL